MRVRTLHHALRLSIDPLKLWKDGCSVYVDLISTKRGLAVR